MKLEFSQQNLEKSSNTKLHKNSSSGAELFHADRRTEGRTDRLTAKRTDMTKLIVAVRSFANAPKNVVFNVSLLQATPGFKTQPCSLPLQAEFRATPPNSVSFSLLICGFLRYFRPQR
jgi:hypothetical protein